MTVSNSTDTNQASEDELRRYHRSSCAKYETLRGIYPNDRRLTGDSCSCGIETLIRTEKLKLLAEVREQVIGEDVSIVGTTDANLENQDTLLYVQAKIAQNITRSEQREALTKLEAEL